MGQVTSKGSPSPHLVLSSLRPGEFVIALFCQKLVSFSFLLLSPFFAFLQLPCFVPCHTKTQQPVGARDQSVSDKDKSVLRTGTGVQPIRKRNLLLK